jgi:hypothetical protein
MGIEKSLDSTLANEEELVPGMQQPWHPESEEGAQNEIVQAHEQWAEGHRLSIADTVKKYAPQVPELAAYIAGPLASLGIGWETGSVAVGIGGIVLSLVGGRYLEYRRQLKAGEVNEVDHPFRD